MKITKSRLMRIIREELENVLYEARQPGTLPVGTTVGAQRRDAARRAAGSGGLTARALPDPVAPVSEPIKGARARTSQPRRSIGSGGGQFGTRIDVGPGKVKLERLIKKPSVPPAPRAPTPSPRPGAQPWNKLGICDGKWKWLCALVGVTIAGWLIWRDSDEYDESLDPVKGSMYKLYTHCGPEQQLWAFPTKEERQAFMDEIKAAGALPGCEISPGRPPKIMIPPKENQPTGGYTPGPGPGAPEAPAGECQFSVPPRAGNKEEFDCFYQALHYSGGSSGLEFLEEYGQDYNWKDEHTEAYYELLQTGYHHDNIPTHEELQAYDWYKHVPEHVKDFFKSAQSG